MLERETNVSNKGQITLPAAIRARLGLGKVKKLNFLR